MSSASNGTGHSVTDGGGGDNDSRRRRCQVSIGHQLVAAIRAGDLLSLHALLSQQNQGRRRCTVTVDDIHNALSVAALEEGSVESCRILWERLSPRGKQKYCAGINGSGVLHKAVRNGHLAIVRFFLEECNFNVNRKNQYGITPLSYVRDSEEMCLLLLDAGADPNQGGQFGPLYFAVDSNSTQVVRLLLQRGANPNLHRRPSNEEDCYKRCRQRNTDIAIWNGNMEILSMLLQHDALVDEYNYNKSLNHLLHDRHENREIKLSIARLLVEHAKQDHDTAAFMQQSLEIAINEAGNEHSALLLLEAGMDSRSAMYMAVHAGNISICQLLVREYHVDPFHLVTAEENVNDNIATSPFHAAARLPDTSILECFLDLWNERFSSTAGKNGDGDYPIHVVCCNPLVSLQAIKLVVDRQAETLSTVDGEQGLLPFHFAAMWDTSLDVIYYLLKHCPDALHHVGNAATFPAVLGANGSTCTVVETKNGYDAAEQDQAGLATTCGPLVEKKAKMSY